MKIYCYSKVFVQLLQIFLLFPPEHCYTHNLSQIWACRKICCFWVSHKKSSPNIGSEIGKTSENNRSQWLSKNNRTDCDGKNVQKPSTSHRCYIKNIGIASLSKIDHRSSLDHFVVLLVFDLFIQMQSLLQPGGGCSSELERDGGDDPGRIISSYMVMVMMMVMVVGRRRARYVCVVI